MDSMLLLSPVLIFGSSLSAEFTRLSLLIIDLAKVTFQDTYVRSNIYADKHFHHFKTPEQTIDMSLQNGIFYASKSTFSISYILFLFP